MQKKLTVLALIVMLMPGLACTVGWSTFNYIPGVAAIRGYVSHVGDRNWAATQDVSRLAPNSQELARFNRVQNAESYRNGVMGAGIGLFVLYKAAQFARSVDDATLGLVNKANAALFSNAVSGVTTLENGANSAYVALTATEVQEVAESRAKRSKLTAAAAAKPAAPAALAAPATK